MISREGKEEIPPKMIIWLLIFISFYLAAPVLVIPLINISYSAPIMYLLFIETLRRFGGLKISRMPRLAALLLMFWLALFLSFTLNVFSGEIFSDVKPTLIILVKYAYWCIVSLLSLRLLSNTDLPVKVIYSFCLGIIFLGIIVLVEYIGLGGLLRSGWSAVTRLSQNGYGWQFSAFTPFLFYPIFSSKNKWRWLALIGLSIILLAEIINGSRSSWITTSIGIFVFIGLFSLSFPKRVPELWIFGIILAVVITTFVFIPEKHQERVYFRAHTFQTLEKDKSFQVRKLTTIKGWQLFLENPIYGVGPKRFIKESTDIALPKFIRFTGRTQFDKRSAHNSYTMILAETGLLGSIPFALLIIWLATSGLRATFFLAKNGETWSLSLYTSFICLSIHLWTLAGITLTAPWFIYGFMAAMIYRHKKLFVSNTDTQIIR
jgi:O-antigen ligase